MTEERIFTDIIPGGGTVEMSVTATATNTEVETMILSASRFHADAVHEKLAEQFRSWRTALYEMRAELGGPPAPEPHASTLPPCPMPGRMRTWETADSLWLQWIGPGREMSLDNAEAQRVPVSATDSDEDLAAAAERWLTGYGCPPAGTVEWVLPQLIQHRDRLRSERRPERDARPLPAAMTTAERALFDAADVEAREWAAAAVRARREPQLKVLVLYVEDVDVAAEWYRSALGIRWNREKHGDGPEHVSAEVGGVLLELYPRGDRPASRVRIELTVPDVFGDADEAEEPFPRRLLAPDGNVVVLRLL